MEPVSSTGLAKWDPLRTSTCYRESALEHCCYSIGLVFVSKVIWLMAETVSSSPSDVRPSWLSRLLYLGHFGSAGHGSWFHSTPGLSYCSAQGGWLLGNWLSWLASQKSRWWSSSDWSMTYVDFWQTDSSLSCAFSKDIWGTLSCSATYLGLICSSTAVRFESNCSVVIFIHSFIRIKAYEDVAQKCSSP